jgi:lysine 2,3-aminomutase
MNADARWFSLNTLKDLAASWSVPAEPLLAVAETYPFRAPRCWLGLMEGPGDPLWRQVVPDSEELADQGGMHDPLAEEALSPVPNLVHRYPDRVLWLVAHDCALHCRFCTRKRRWQQPLPMTAELFARGFAYLEEHREVSDVLLSGGDPLMLSAVCLENILQRLRRIPHVEIIRIGTRVPGALPERVTAALASMLAQYHPLYLNLHFNHPREITPDVKQACRLLADAGIPLGSQTVLLKGVNDDARVLRVLFKQLLTLRVRPYYLLQMDLTQSTAHFRTPLSTGLTILHALRNHISGLALPQFVIDLPGGHGKVPLLPRTIEDVGEDRLVFKDFHDQRCVYPLLPGEQGELVRWLESPSG